MEQIYDMDEYGIANDYQLLRDNGCYWPTPADVVRVAEAIRSLAVYEKLAGAPSSESRSMLALLRVLKGPDAELDITSTYGYEFSGWFCEIKLLDLAHFITISRGSFNLTLRGKLVISHHKGEEFARKIVDMTGDVVDLLEQSIAHNVNQYGMERRLVRYAFGRRS